MDITSYVEHLRRDLLAAAEAGGPEVRQAAERLTYALDPAVRLALMEAISHAAAQITAEMPAGGVDVRLDGRELAFVVDPAGAGALPTASVPPTPSAPAAAAAADEPEEGVARVTLRIPESVKTRAEELAAAAGHSLNTWLVTVVRHATQQRSDGADLDLSSIPFQGGGDPFRDTRGPGVRSSRVGRRLTGWQ